MNTMAKWVMRHLLGYSYNLYTGFEDQLKDVECPRSFGMIYITKTALNTNPMTKVV